MKFHHNSCSGNSSPRCEKTYNLTTLAASNVCLTFWRCSSPDQVSASPDQAVVTLNRETSGPGQVCRNIYYANIRPGSGMPSIDQANIGPGSGMPDHQRDSGPAHLRQGSGPRRSTYTPWCRTTSCHISNRSRDIDNTPNITPLPSLKIKIRPIAHLEYISLSVRPPKLYPFCRLVPDRVRSPMLSFALSALWIPNHRGGGVRA